MSETPGSLRGKVRGDVDRMIKAHRRYRVGDTVMLSATAMALALIGTHASAQTWKEILAVADPVIE